MEVDASFAERRGGLRAFAREAESKWGLEPNTFSLTGTSGKVDSVSALQRELMAASTGICKVEVHESAEGKMMREMRAAVKACEDRMLAKLEAAIANVQKDCSKVNAQVSGALAPMVQCLALEQVELRNSMQNVKAQVASSLAPMVQCLALEQMELRNKVDDAVADINNLSATMPVDLADAMKSLEDIEKDLQQDCALQAACDLEKAAQDDLARFRMDVCSLELVPKHPVQDVNVVSSQQPISQKECEQLPQQTKYEDNYSSAADVRFAKPQPPAVSFAYSNKAIAPPPSLPFDAKWCQREMWGGLQSGSDDVALFSQGVVAPRFMSANRACWGSRSMPILPPLQ